MLRLALALAVLCSGLAGSADAQIFRGRGFSGGGIFRPFIKQSGCPNGICPTTARANTNHWTFPGSIDNHLQTGHGVNPSGMSQEQMLNMHDALHEGRSVPQVAPVQYQQAPRIITSSTITVAPMAPVAVRPNDVPIAVAELATFVPMAAEPGFRGQLRGAITDARKLGKIDIRTAVKLQRLTFSPAFVDAAQDLAVTQMVLSGEDPDRIPRTPDGRVDVAGINWDGLGKFLQLLLPFLLEFLKGLGL